MQAPHGADVHNIDGWIFPRKAETMSYREVSVTFEPAGSKWVGSTWHIRRGSVLLAVTTSRSRAVEEAFHAGLSRSDAERMVNQVTHDY